MSALAGTVAVVTGASHGIGYGVARALLREGARVTICSRSADAVVEALVCSHGTYVRSEFLELTDEQWETTIGTNLTGCFMCGQEAARSMVAGGRRGRVVLLSSINAFRADPGCADYGASKAGVHLLARGMACDLAPHGITVNVVVPGWIRSPMSEPFIDGAVIDQDTGRFTLNLAGRVGEPEDIANAVVWLAQPATGYVTGQILTVDGGQTAMLHSLF